MVGGLGTSRGGQVTWRTKEGLASGGPATEGTPGTVASPRLPCSAGEPLGLEGRGREREGSEGGRGEGGMKGGAGKVK